MNVNEIRTYEKNSLSKKQVGINVILFFVIGMVLGIVPKYMDTVPSNGVIGSTINVIANIFSQIEVWVLIATIISSWSKTPISAALNVFMFFFGMILSYYIYSMELFGFFSKLLFYSLGTNSLIITFWSICNMVWPRAGLDSCIMCCSFYWTTYI